MRTWVRPLWWAAVLAGTCGCATRPADVQAPAAYPLRTVIGLCEDYPEESRSLQAAVQDLQRARETGATVLRIAFGWDAIEAQPGQYDWSFWDEFVPLAVETYGLRLIPYVCYTPAWAASEAGPDAWRSPPRDLTAFTHFMEVISARYDRWVDSWEIWNEPDNPAYWTADAAAYAELLHAGAQGVERGDPAADIVLGGIAWDLDFLRELFADHQAASAVDVVNVHSYFETWHEDPIEALPTYLEEAARILVDHGEAEPLWMAEVGYSSPSSGAARISEVYRARYASEHTPEYQAAALARTILLSLSTGRLSLLAWYRINDLPATQEVIGDSNNLHLGIYGTDGTAKPAQPVLAWLAGQFAQPYRAADAEFLISSHGETTVESRCYALADGRRLVTAWIPPGATPRAEQALEEDVRAAQITVVPALPVERLVETQYAPNRAAEARLESPRRLTFPLRGGEVAMILLE